MKRYLVLCALFVLSLITYIDRACISSAKGPIADELSLTDQQMGAVFSAFALGYAIAQVPAGWLADRYGPRLALAAVVILWSLLTAGTGLVQSFSVLWMVRFWFGIGEAGAFPGSARAIFNWLPAARRGLANGILFSGSRIGAALAFPLFAWLIPQSGWRKAFFLFGVIGIVWALAWVAFFRNHPDETVAEAEIKESGETKLPSGFGVIFRSRPMLLAMTQYFASNFTFFICLSWMLPYLQTQYRLQPHEAASYAMIPLLCGAAAQWCAGLLVDWLYRSGWRAWSRRIPASFGFMLAMTGMLGITQAESVTTAVACFALATFGADLTISPSWAYCLDIGGQNAGAISGSMNMIGNFGSFVSANAFPWLLRLTGASGTYFVIAALLNAAAVVCWLLMTPPESSLPDQTEPCLQSDTI